MAFLERNANRGSISTGFDIENSLKLEADNNEHLYRAMANGNRRTWTFSCWIKRTKLLLTNSLAIIHFGVNHQVVRMFIDDTNDQLYLDVCNTENELYRSITNRRFRDTSAWYHFVWRMDTTQGTAADRMKLYINGVEETSWAQHQLPPQNYDTLANTTAGGYDDMGIGTFVWAGSSYDGLFSGYIAQVAHVDGQSYAPTEFGEFDDDSGIWKPKNVSGLTYGTSNNSFFLDFEDSSDLGANAKGNDANWSLTNVAAADQSTDTPTNNFCTLNPLWTANPSYVGIIRNGATTLRYSSGTKASAKTTFGVTSGKWYWEGMPNGTIGSQYLGIQTDVTFNSGTGLSQDYTMAIGAHGAYYSYSGSLSETSSAFTALTTSNVIGVALDLDSSTQTIKYYKDGSVILSLNLISNMQDETIFPFIQNYENRSFNLNFGGYTINTISSAATDANGYGTFEHAPPSGYYAICTKNLAEFG